MSKSKDTHQEYDSSKKDIDNLFESTETLISAVEPGKKTVLLSIIQPTVSEELFEQNIQIFKRVFEKMNMKEKGDNLINNFREIRTYHNNPELANYIQEKFDDIVKKSITQRVERNSHLDKLNEKTSNDQCRLL